MSKSSLFVNFGLLKSNYHFRMVFIARMMSVLALGMMTVAVPIQVHEMTGSTLQVGMIVALDGIGMFAGLLLGGVLADRYDRRKLILLARFTCGVGFAALALNSFIASPSLIALYILSVWDGFFGAMGMTALMAAIPNLVGRENLATAGALSMLTMRLGTVLSPAIGGLIIASGDVSWNYTAASIGTLGTLIPLVRLPSMKPELGEPEHPVRALIGGFQFLFSNRIVGSVILIGTLAAIAGAVRVFFPALASDSFGGGAIQVGLMFSAIPMGAMVGAFTSGWVQAVRRPGVVTLFFCVATFSVLSILGITQNFYIALAVLASYGYLNGISGLLQFTIVQGHTPDHLLGRINSLWTAQDVTGDSVGALGLGAIGKVLAPAITIFYFGAGLAIVGIIFSICFRALRNASIADKALIPDADNSGSAENVRLEPQESIS